MIRFETINEAGGGQLAEMLGRENIPFEGEAIVFIGALVIMQATSPRAIALSRQSTP